MEALECGAASLSMVLSYHGAWLPLEKLRELCGVSRDGSKASNILKAARSLGMEAKGYRKSPEKVFEDADYPAIVHWNMNHFLVLEGKKGQKVYINDPASGQREVTLEEFDKSFSGVILHFKKEDHFEPVGKAPSLWLALIKRLQAYKSVVLYLFILSFMLLVPGLLIPLFSKIFIDQIMIQGMTSWGKTLLLCMVITAILNMLLTSLQQKCLLRFKTKLSLRESGQLLLHMLMLPLRFYSQRFPGEVGQRVAFPQQIAMLLSGKISVSFFALILMVFYGVVMWQYSPLLTLICIFTVMFNTSLSEYFAKVRGRSTEEMMMNQGKLMGTSMGGVQMIETIKATASENDLFSKWAGYHAKVLQAEQKMSYLANIMAVLPVTVDKFLNLAVLALGSMMIINGDMTIGNLIAFQLLVASFLLPVNQLIALGPEVQELTGTMNKVDDIFKYELDDDSKKALSDQPVSSDTTKLKGDVMLDSISFGYSPLEEPLIKDFSMNVPAGKTVAFVGPSGSGKSTMSALIAGLQNPSEGAVLLDGVNRGELHRVVVTSSVTMVTQTIFLFEGTIRDNLTMWDPTIPEEDIVRACKDACIHDVITERDEGYSAVIREGGANFSGGQCQRLEIAKALALNPSVLILDEATSALDPVVEKRIMDNIKARGCTCVIVAHRLSTIRDAEEIIVLDTGSVVERGSHSELLSLDGAYSKLVAEI